MRVDASLAALFLSGLAGAHSFGYNSTNGTNSTSSGNHQVISQLQKEIQELRQKLADAGSSCDINGNGGLNSGSATSPWEGSASATGYGSIQPSNGQGSSHVSQASAATSGAGSAGGASPSTYQQGTPSSVSTQVTTITNQYSTVVSTIYVTNTLAPAASSAYGSAAASNAGASSYGSAAINGPGGASSVASGAGSASVASTKTPDYYAPLPPASTSTAASTVTIIVTAGQSAPANSGAASSAGVDTCTETYAGSGTIPSQPASTSMAVSSSSGSASSVNGEAGSSSSAPYGFANSTTRSYPTGSAASSGFVSKTSIQSSSLGTAVSASISSTATANATSSISSSAKASSTAAANLTDCSSLCSTLTKFNDWDVTPETCTQLKAGTLVNTPSGQSSVGCAASFTPEIDVCQVTLNIKTSGTANTYMEVWLPNANSSSWNGRTMSTDNGGLNGCVHYVDMQYVSGMGFAAIGDNAGHNGSSFDGTWTMNNNEAVVDWAWRARHASVDIGKQLVNQFYSKAADYSYYIGCSAGGAQGLQSAQKFPNDFDGIISGSSANDFNHLQDWSAHFRQITGATGNDTFLSINDWTTVQTYILAQCDEPLDGVADGILEDPTLCQFNVSAIPVCGATTSGCLTATQIDTVEQVFKPLYNGNNLIYPALLYGAQVDAFRLGLLSGSIQGIAQDFFRGAVYNDSSFNILNIGPADWNRADQLDNLHGNPSAFNGDLSGFSGAGKKLMMYHGMADPMTSGTNSQRYYQKVAATMGLSNTEIDNFMRFYRISGMAHCGVGGISGAGAWMFGQSGLAAPATDNIVTNLVDWVESGAAPDSLLGTKFWYDTPSMGIEFERRHCRYPYRTTYTGGDSTKPDSWTCDFIENWQDCEGVTCNADGTFT
ncbi:hypothetical protein LTR78_004052 [Recurvomyces mirabilis]|uniref:Carboxylic ester hydrolase n=1 Tax=Recurvomyces mirabilis TaxID=574656 RepID=A0AAE1C333_9PEZI|nr:hypothetical protein LTR78_004052 [Recurvomyces mirabilis]